MSNVAYFYNTKRVRQVLGTIYSGGFEGDFAEAANRFTEEYAGYKKYLEEPHEVVERDGYGRLPYLDGVDKKTVKFDKLILIWQDIYDDERVLRVFGERDMDAGELAGYELVLEKSKQHEIKQLQELKKKYPNA